MSRNMMRSGNPALSKKTIENLTNTSGGVMTLDGTVEIKEQQKTKKAGTIQKIVPRVFRETNQSISLLQIGVTCENNLLQ